MGSSEIGDDTLDGDTGGYGVDVLRGGGMMRWHTPIGATLKNSSCRVRPCIGGNGILGGLSTVCRSWAAES